MADNQTFEDLRPPKPETDSGPALPIITETLKKPHFINGHLIVEGTPYTVEESDAL